MSQSKTLARQFAVQALYQWQLTRENIPEIDRQFSQEREIKPRELAYFRELLHKIPEHLSKIDKCLGEFVDRSLDKIDPVERAILRIGVYELLYKLEIPYRVVLNEGINLAKMFGATQSHKYVNGILDKVAHSVRPSEIKAKRSS